MARTPTLHFSATNTKRADNDPPLSIEDAAEGVLINAIHHPITFMAVDRWTTDAHNLIRSQDISPLNISRFFTPGLMAILDDKEVSEELSYANFPKSAIVSACIYKLLNHSIIKSLLENFDKKNFLEAIDQYAKEHPGQPVSPYILKRFPLLERHLENIPRYDQSNTSVDELPKEAPFLFKNRADKSILPVDFVREHYQPWIGKGLARNHLRTLDNYLYVQLSLQLKKDPKALDFDLPTKSVAADRWAARVKADPEAEQNAKDGQRLHSILYRRQKAGREL